MGAGGGFSINVGLGSGYFGGFNGGSQYIGGSFDGSGGEAVFNQSYQGVQVDIGAGEGGGVGSGGSYTWGWGPDGSNNGGGGGNANAGPGGAGGEGGGEGSYGPVGPLSYGGNMPAPSQSFATNTNPAGMFYVNNGFGTLDPAWIYPWMNGGGPSVGVGGNNTSGNTTVKL